MLNNILKSKMVCVDEGGDQVIEINGKKTFC